MTWPLLVNPWSLPPIFFTIFRAILELCRPLSNEKKTEYINKCNNDSDFLIKKIQDKLLQMVSDYAYLGSYISSSEKYFLTRKGKAWAACNAMNKIWPSDVDRNFKLKKFKAAVEPILLYGSETWTLSKKLEKIGRLDGTDT